MSESQDLTEPILDPILLITEGTASLPSCSSDVAPLDSLSEFDSLCTVDVFGKLHERDRQRISQQRSLEAYQEGIRSEDGTTSVRRKQHTVLSKINDQWSHGPISILHKALTNKLRVKVWVRNHSTVRSILTGFVAAFDKHLNLALVDVDEAICLRKDDIKSTSLTPEQDLRDLRAVHNEQEYLATANTDEHCTDDDFEFHEPTKSSHALPVDDDDVLNEDDRADSRLAAEKRTNDSEERHNNNAVSHDRSQRDTDASTSTTEAEKAQTAKEKTSDEKKTASQAGSSPTKETEQKSGNSDEQQRGEKASRESLEETVSLALGEPPGVSEKGVEKSVNKKSMKKSRLKSKTTNRGGPPTLSQRFIPQLFVRGEQVVMIAFADI